MIIIDVIETVDALYPNKYTAAEKIAWCDELGHMLKEEYARSYVGSEETEKYSPIKSPVEDETVVPAPYDAMYVDFVLAKCCFYQRDYNAYNQHISAFNAKLEDYAKWYIERNMPKRDSENKINGWW